MGATPEQPEDMLLSLRTYLLVRAMEQGCTFVEAARAVALTLDGQKFNPALHTYREWCETLEKGQVK